MSQASRLHALRHETERRQVARELVQFIALPADGRHADFDMDDPGTVEILLRDHVFDVHAARAHALEFLAMEQEQAVFEDWTRERGRGPESVGLFVRCRDNCTECICDTNPETTDGADYDCPHHGWVKRASGAVRRWGSCECNGQHPWDGTLKLKHWPGKLAREWARRQNPSQRQDGPPASGSPKPQLSSACSAPMGRSLARLGQRILDMLEGQPSECQGCSGTLISAAKGRDLASDELAELAANCDREMTDREELEHQVRLARLLGCEDCHGTGHNLRGKLPGVEWSPAVISRATDGLRTPSGSAESHSPESPRGRTERLQRTITRQRLLVDGDGMLMPTRVCPRGEHRAPTVEVIERNGRRVELRDQMRGWIPKDSPAAGPARRRPGPECLPAWARGEAEHARQRREWDERGQRQGCGSVSGRVSGVSPASRA